MNGSKEYIKFLLEELKRFSSLAIRDIGVHDPFHFHIVNRHLNGYFYTVGAPALAFESLYDLCIAYNVSKSVESKKFDVEFILNGLKAIEDINFVNAITHALLMKTFLTIIDYVLKLKEYERLKLLCVDLSQHFFYQMFNWIESFRYERFTFPFRNNSFEIDFGRYKFYLSGLNSSIGIFIQKSLIEVSPINEHWKGIVSVPWFSCDIPPAYSFASVLLAFQYATLYNRDDSDYLFMFDQLLSSLYMMFELFQNRLNRIFSVSGSDNYVHHLYSSPCEFGYVFRRLRHYASELFEDYHFDHEDLDKVHEIKLGKGLIRIDSKTLFLQYMLSRLPRLFKEKFLHFTFHTVKRVEQLSDIDYAFVIEPHLSSIKEIVVRDLFVSVDNYLSDILSVIVKVVKYLKEDVEFLKQYVYRHYYAYEISEDSSYYEDPWSYPFEVWYQKFLTACEFTEKLL